MNDRSTAARVASRNELPMLDGVRGLAMVGVVAFHVAVIWTDNAPWAYREAAPVGLWPAFTGSLGVDVFFVLSGFLVFQSWQSIRRRHTDESVRSVIEFARRRARRIYPPYLVVLAVLIPIRTPGWLDSADGWANIGLFVSLNHFLVPRLPHALNTPLWTLTTETHFYVALPFMAFVGFRYGWRKMLVALLLTTIVWRVYAGGTGGSAEWILGRADQFAAGMVASTLFADHRAGRPSALLRWLTGRWAGWVLGLAFTCLAVAHGGLRLLPKPLAFLVLLHPVAALLIAGLVVRGVCNGGLRVFRHPLLRWAGAISYSLYLWHFPVLTEAVKRTGRGAGTLVGALAVALAFGVVSYLLLERPFIGRRVHEPAPTSA